jgi:CRP-like cAMP-binding protein
MVKENTLKDFLQEIELFMGLDAAQLEDIVSLCHLQRVAANTRIIERNTPPDSLYLIRFGTVEIITPSVMPESGLPVVISLGRGQSFGEMGLVDQGRRSATVKTVTETELLVIDSEQLKQKFEQNTDLGYVVMRNIAADLSFKLRNRNLI